MSFVNADDPDSDQICDSCGLVGKFDASKDITAGWWHAYKGAHKQEFHYMQFCRPCALRMTPGVHRHRDAYELHLFVNRLERAIREKRTQNNWSVARHAGQRR